MKSSVINIKRILLAIIILLVGAGIVMFLNRPASNSVDIKTTLPSIGSSPIYVEMTDGEELVRSYTPSEDVHLSSLELLLVNTTGTDDATISVTIREDGSELAGSTIGLTDVPVGDWMAVGMDAYLEAGKTYEIAFLPTGANPYFMQVSGYDLDISVGFDSITDKIVTYGDIFYYSIPIVIFVTVIFVFVALFGIDACIGALRKLDFVGFVSKWGNIAFLVLLFVTLALKIYSIGYVKGVYITADSDGYLREAVNLYNGNGFSYDGIAGYKSWFANWPIIYPAMITGMMIITGANAYLASKYVAIAIIALIEIVLLLAFKKDAWVYALSLTNLGVLGLAYHTWSEIPFMLFMLIFALALAKIVSNDKVSPVWYVLLCFAGTATYLTRYFGIFVWFVAGLYFLMLLIIWWKNKNDKTTLSKLIGLAISAFTSGVTYIAYLAMNKINNGNPTGVSRGTWWDDYHTLTDDLITSLVIEIFNVFGLEVPERISALTVELQVLFVIAVTIGVAILIHNGLNRVWGKAEGNREWLGRYMNTEAVLIITALVYYAMFIVIRYRSSMDTFYFRFFAPATFLLTLGICGLVLRMGLSDKVIHGFAAFVTVIVIASLINICQTTDFTHQNDYYDITCASWDEMYMGIPEKSVVIWSGLDYRSTWYRPDVVGGEIYESDTLDTLAQRYYGSDYVCISLDYVDTILNEGNYDSSIKDAIQIALNSRMRFMDYLYFEI